MGGWVGIIYFRCLGYVYVYVYVRCLGYVCVFCLCSYFHSSQFLFRFVC